MSIGLNPSNKGKEEDDLWNAWNIAAGIQNNDCGNINNNTDI